MTVRIIGTTLTDMSVKKQKKEATEASLIEAAIKVFREVGYAKARVSDIVSQAGVSQGTFYLYFKSKEDILRRIISSLKDNFNKALEDVDVVFAGETAEEMLHSLSMFLEKALAMHHENIGAAEIMWREGFGHGGVFAELYSETYSYFIEIIRARMKEAAARGLISCERIDDSAVFLVSLFERSSFYFMVIEGGVEIPRLASNLARFILFGLLPETKIAFNNQQNK